jgi:NitT/TauT family transport system permease protein
MTAIASFGSATTRYGLTLRRLALPAAGVVGAIIFWQFATFLIPQPEFREGFSPTSAAKALVGLVASPRGREQIMPSLARVFIGLSIATAVGIPGGILIGYSRVLDRLTNPVVQFGRMTSPLAWMPIAIIIFGIGDRPVYFLIAIAALWPILLNTANGVRNVDQTWIRVVQMLGANRRDVLRRAIIPAVIPDMLIGLRISLGVSWIVLVPAEMLGVSSGLGYYILDTRDRFNYAELMAVILVVGALGYATDSALGLLQRKLSWREQFQRVTA